MSTSRLPTVSVLPPATPGELRVRTREHRGWVSHHISVSAAQADAPAGWVAELQRFLAAAGAELVTVETFGDPAMLQRFQAALPPGCDWPLCLVQGRPTPGVTAGGLHAHAVSGIQPKPLYLGTKRVGAWFDDGLAAWCFLSGVDAENPGLERAVQAEQTLQRLEHLLAQAGFTFGHVVRTWFYLDDILAWYAGFNRVRNDFFVSRGIFGGVMPASTGVGAAHPDGLAVSARAVAVRRHNGMPAARQVGSPMQCEAMLYGSAFSRAVEIAVHGARALLVSGTASIGAGGKIVHAGDPAAQIGLAMDVVKSLLARAGMAWQHVTRLTAYFRDAQDIPLWHDHCRRHQLPPLPGVLAQCDVCRDDLRFEVEVDAEA